MSIVKSAEIKQKNSEDMQELLDDFDLLLDKAVMCRVPDRLFGELNAIFQELYEIYRKSHYKN